MPGLVVPALRLAMVFLNIYESYKTLKDPPPSARNGGRPSQRAISQRKRDIKGCLAVWIVWCCFITYERMAEAVVGLFIPFYDEIKSLVLLFLIMTRARGAEPIFLHIIRPFLKPYTPTLDILLDFVCMLGDILFALLTFPIQSALAWWKKTISYNDGTLDSEPEMGADISPHGDKEDSDAADSRPLSTPARTAPLQRGNIGPKLSRKVSTDQGSNRLPSGGLRRGDPQVQDDISYPQLPPDGLPNGSSAHQIWHPPPSSFTEDDFPDDPGATIRSRRRPNVKEIFDLAPGSQGTIEEIEEIEEWRKYPAFPSAYPPTPQVNSSSRLPTSATNGGIIEDNPALSDIPENYDLPQQDFRQSLLPPRKPLNPGFVGDLSDDYLNPGVQNDHFDEMVIDVDSGTDDEEDVFNMTLQTPLTSPKKARTRLQAVPLNVRESSKSSIASCSTALTTAGHGSSLRTQSSSDLGSVSSVSAAPLSDVSSVLGRKRPLSRTNVANIRRKVDFVEKTLTKNTSSNSSDVPRRSRTRSPTTSTGEELSSSSDDKVNENTNNNQAPLHMKRRKVLVPPARAVKPVRPIRSRATRNATLPIRSQQRNSFNPPSLPSRKSPRLRTGLPGVPSAPIMIADSSQSSASSPHDPQPSRRTRANENIPTNKL